MNSQRTELRSRMLAVRNLAIDRLAAEVSAAFTAEGIETLVLKGPVLAKWLYPDVVRPYGDADLMVAPQNWDSAVAILTGLGFSDPLGPMAHPRMESFASTAFLRGDNKEDNLDLHCTLHGLDGDPERIWQAFSDGAMTQTIGGAELRVPGRDAQLLHVGLHAAHHVEMKQAMDLRRAIEVADDDLWRQAPDPARPPGGPHAFASGLRLLPDGAQLAERLGIRGGGRPTPHRV